MSTNYTHINIRNSYFRNNKIRTKLLLFIDNEIQTKIKQNNRYLKYNWEDETVFRISFEENFTQKQINNYIFPISNSKKNDNLHKSSSTIDVSSNKNTEKLQQNERGKSHSKTFTKEDNNTDKLVKNNFCFHKKIYSIKNLSRQSSTFLILPKQKSAAEYLKTLCNSLKIRKINKKPVVHLRSITINTKLFDLNNDNKVHRKSNELKIRKSKKDNLYTYSLFKKAQKGNLLITSKKRISRKSTNSILITN